MSQEQFITYLDSASLLLPKHILEMLEVDTKGEVRVSIADRTLTARPVDEAGCQEGPSPVRTNKRIAGLNRGMVWMSEDFDAPLPDEFWLGQE